MCLYSYNSSLLFRKVCMCHPFTKRNFYPHRMLSTFINFSILNIRLDDRVSKLHFLESSFWNHRIFHIHQDLDNLDHRVHKEYYSKNNSYLHHKKGINLCLSSLSNLGLNIESICLVKLGNSFYFSRRLNM